MKDAIRFLEQYADEVEDEGLNALADEIRECAVSLKALVPKVTEGLPRVVSDSPKTLEYQDTHWVQKSYLQAREGAWVQKYQAREGAWVQKYRALEAEIDRTRGRRDPSPTAEWSAWYDPMEHQKIQEIKVRFRASGMLTNQQEHESVLSTILEGSPRNIGKSVIPIIPKMFQRTPTLGSRLARDTQTPPLYKYC